MLENLLIFFPLQPLGIADIILYSSPGTPWVIDLVDPVDIIVVVDTVSLLWGDAVPKVVGPGSVGNNAFWLQSNSGSLPLPFACQHFTACVPF
jgi:hypothetical protein